MNASRQRRLNRQISAEAAEWLVEFRTGEIAAGGRRDFDAWVRTSPEHIRAFIEMAVLWNESGAIDPQRRIDVEAIIARAREERTVVPLIRSGTDRAAARTLEAAVQTSKMGTADAAEQTRGRKSRSTRAAKWSIAAGLLVVTLISAWLLKSNLFGLPTYSTGVRARQSIVLPDGSRVVLDSRSRLQVDFTADARTVDLLQGQALFYVVKNPRRPFFVRAGNAIVRDVGTVFDVNRRGTGTIITVVEGRVAVATQHAASGHGGSASLPSQLPVELSAPAGLVGPGAMRPIVLSGGEQVDVLAGHTPPQPTRVDVSSTTSWIHGEVVLESATLKKVAAVFNRYSARKIVTQDRGTRPLRLSGVFSTNPDFLIKYLRERPDIVITETGSQINIVREP